MIRRVGDFLYLAQCGYGADAFGEDIDRDFGCNRGGCATKGLPFFVRGFFEPFLGAIHDGVGDALGIFARGVADGVRCGAQWCECS